MSSTYDYAIIRVVPRVERGEQINAGVVLSCATAQFLGEPHRCLFGNVGAVSP